MRSIGKLVKGGKGTIKGLTGIETAIILIAMVLVAAAFAFVVLNMGGASAQKAGETIKAGMEEAASALELAGAVVAQVDTTTSTVQKLVIYVKPGVGRMPLPLDNITVAVTTEDGHRAGLKPTQISITGNDPLSATCTTDVCYAEIRAKQVDGVLESGEIAVFIINVPTGLTLGPNQNVLVELRPPSGGVLRVERRMPMAFTTTVVELT